MTCCRQVHLSIFRCHTSVFFNSTPVRTVKQLALGFLLVPANKEPHITKSAPAARALTISPEVLIPPSAMILTSLSVLAQSKMVWRPGRPCPVTIRVEQMEPPPMLHRTALAPQSATSLMPSSVQTFPAII